MLRNPPWRALPSVTCSVAADPRLVRQVLGGVVTEIRGEMAGHVFERVEATSPTEALIRFRGSVAGREFATIERVAVTELGVHFEQVSGYLPGVEEDITVAAAHGGSLVAYGGRYRPRPGPLARLVGMLLVPVIYRREAVRTLRSTKQLAEARQAKSALFRTGAG